MPGPIHTFAATTVWRGETTQRGSYSRDHVIEMNGKPDLAVSSGTAKLANHALHNPEDLLVGALASCHMLWYLALCAQAGVTVTEYLGHTEGEMEETADGGGHFTRVVLRPVITLAAGSDEALADVQHHEAHELCFIAQSVNFPITVEATYRFA